jgi:hypothetical protein
MSAVLSPTMISATTPVADHAERRPPLRVGHEVDGVEDGACAIAKRIVDTSARGPFVISAWVAFVSSL